MARVQSTTNAAGPVPAGEVWERYADPARWASWAPQIRRVATAERRIAPGVTGTAHGPLGVPVAFVVTAVDEQARTWAWTVRLGPLRMHLRHGVDDDGSGSTTWLTVRGPAPVLAVYLPVARLALHHLVTRP